MSLYNFFELVMLYLLRQGVIGHTLDGHVANFFNTNAADYRLLKMPVDLKHIYGVYCNIHETQNWHHHGREQIEYGVRDEGYELYCRDG